MRVDSPAALWGIFLVSLLFAVSFCSADDKTFQVVGTADCADCKEYNVKTSQAYSGLRVSIDCKLENGEMKRVGDGALDKEGKFKVSVPQELKEDCYAQLHSAAAVPCPAHNGLEAAKIVLISQNNGIQTFGPNKNLKFSTALCASKTFWSYHNWPPLPPLTHPYHNWPPLPPLTHPYHSWPPLPPVTHPWKKIYHSWPPLPPLYKHKPLPPPVPVSTPAPVYKPPVPVYKPPVPVYKPPVPVYKPPVPVYKPPVVKPLPPVPIYKPKPPVPVYKPPVVKPLPPVPIYKPKPPVYKPKPPVYTPKPKPPVYKPKPKPPVYKPLPPTVYKKPCPPLPKLSPLPKFPPKYFHHHHPKYGYFPPLPPHHP